MCKELALNNTMIRYALSIYTVPIYIYLVCPGLNPLSMNLFLMLLPHFESLPIQFSLAAGRSRGKNGAARSVAEGTLMREG